ncbi:IS66 family insertion sequence element accessory protein TnpB [Paraburkholderia unamae]|uniref:IS66 family insertion sequence element accessory protein TnpB n=1 Tax=Paraburkholderia unamae TaxID=219649 RepID=UPI0035A256B3
MYLHSEPVDFRVGINGLSILVAQAMRLSPMSLGSLDIRQPTSPSNQDTRLGGLPSGQKGQEGPRTPARYRSLP